MNPDSEPASPAAIAGGFGALAACCAVKVLIIGGVVAGASGAAIGGIALAVGLAAAAVAWLAVSLLRRRAPGQRSRSVTRRTKMRGKPANLIA